MKLMRKDLKANERITTYFALESLQLRTSKTQQQYLVVELCDKTGKIKGYLWDDPIEAIAALQEKSYVKVRGITRVNNVSIVLNIERIRTADKSEVDIRDFLDVVPGGIDHWYKRLEVLIHSMKDSNCLNLVRSFINDEGFIELFITSPGALSVHHNYVGGLLEHTVSSMEQASSAAERYQCLLDRDLMLTGTFIHDIGKVREIYWEIGREFTTEGRLLGHIAIGLMMLDEKLSGLQGFPDELALLLKHMLLSHHGSLEFGSPVVPATPEAVALNLIENTDAKINHLYCHLGNSNSEDDWSHFDKILYTGIYRRRFPKSDQKALKGMAA